MRLLRNALAVVSKDITDLERHLQEFSITDEFTGLQNRRGFETLAATASRRSGGRASKPPRSTRTAAVPVIAQMLKPRSRPGE